jgi:hypothetical protein
VPKWRRSEETGKWIAVKFEFVKHKIGWLKVSDPAVERDLWCECGQVKQKTWRDTATRKASLRYMITLERSAGLVIDSCVHS